MLQGTTRLREQDKFGTFDVGTDFLAGFVINKTDVIRHGETIYAQCHLNPPHEDMWVECNLHDANDVEIDYVGVPVIRESMRASFQYTLTEALPPGEYDLVLKSRGQEITRRRITLQPRTSMAAN
jgi:hypothetical protein